MTGPSDKTDLELIRGMADRHGPKSWQEEISLADLQRAVREGIGVSAIVLDTDIRSSTALMRESMQPLQFAWHLSYFVNAIREFLRARRGWFDKFTGDGFLAYWLLGNRRPEDYADEIGYFANVCISLFRDRVMDELRKFTQNMPAQVGISLGLDGGMVHLVEVAGDLTPMGPPVVGAVRMVGTAGPYEAVANGVLGNLLPPVGGAASNYTRYSAAREIRPTKEYPQGQEVYVVRFLEAVPFPLPPAQNQNVPSEAQTPALAQGQAGAAVPPEGPEKPGQGVSSR